MPIRVVVLDYLVHLHFCYMAICQRYSAAWSPASLARSALRRSAAFCFHSPDLRAAGAVFFAEVFLNAFALDSNRLSEVDWLFESADTADSQKTGDGIIGFLFPRRQLEHPRFRGMRSPASVIYHCLARLLSCLLVRFGMVFLVESHFYLYGIYTSNGYLWSKMITVF